MNAPLEPSDRAERAAEVLLRLRAAGPRPRSLPAELAPASEPEAYAIQRALALRLGAQVGGWKVSMSTPERGTWAPIFAEDLYPSPARIGSRIADGVGIEPEVAFSLSRALSPQPGVPYSRNEVIAAIEGAHAAIEIVVSRFQSHEGAEPLDRLADNISNAGLVFGPPCRDWQRLDLRTLALRLKLRYEDGNSTEHAASGGHPLGDPLTPLLWLINELSQRGVTAPAGALITTGSYAGLRAAPRGAHVLVEFAGLGAALLDVPGQAG
jgi:2-keto-4-pentenoate hydratase